SERHISWTVKVYPPVSCGKDYLFLRIIENCKKRWSIDSCVVAKKVWGGIDENSQFFIVKSSK
uniref:MATH domain-containing protein n=1 Tax=Megaselia scalaris TaxID=36166 RepID=T1GYJ0_MEGSC